MLCEFTALDADALRTPEIRDQFIARYGFAIPDEDALGLIRSVSGSGVVEIGAGTGYWARLLADRGSRVAAYDIAPPPSSANMWFGGSAPWYDVRPHDETVVDRAPPATLLLVWPTRNEAWSMAAAQRFHRAGGATLVFVGEGPGGRTGDDGLHAVLGEISGCAHCRYGVVDSPCVCGVVARWRRIAEHEIPTWPGYTDTVRVYERIDEHGSRRAKTRRSRGR